MSATPAVAQPCAHGRVVSTDDDVASQAAALVDALRRKRGAEIPAEIALAQDSLERRIRAHMAKGRVSVTLTDNRYTMISVRRLPKQTRYEVRLHHMFADADPVITRALARYVAENDAEASRILGDFIDSNSGHVRGRARRQPAQVIFTAGEVHDIRIKNGRREFHSKAFLADEAMYEHSDHAKAWERQHLDALLTY